MARAGKVNFFKCKRKFFKSNRDLSRRRNKRMRLRSSMRTPKKPTQIKSSRRIKKKPLVVKKPVMFTITNMDDGNAELNQKENKNTNIILDKPRVEEKRSDQNELVKESEGTVKNKICPEVSGKFGTEVQNQIDTAEVLENVNASVIVLDDTIVASPDEKDFGKRSAVVTIEQSHNDKSFFFIDICENQTSTRNVDPNDSIYFVSTEPESTPEEKKVEKLRRRKRKSAAQTWKDVKSRKRGALGPKPVEVITLSDSDSDSDECLIVSDDSDGGVVRALENFIPLGPAASGAGKTKSQLTSTATKSSEESQELGDLRPIVIDGCNVAFGHGRRVKFSCEGLKICSDYFKERGHKIYVFIPQFRRRHHQTTNFAILDEMEKEGSLICTPSRRVNDKLICSYDDRFIVEFASKKGAIIVTRDNYRDLMSENNNSWKETISKRLLMYTFVEDMIMFPDDPLGRDGPKLKEFLRFPK